MPADPCWLPTVAQAGWSILLRKTIAVQTALTFWNAEFLPVAYCVLLLLLDIWLEKNPDFF